MKFIQANARVLHEYPFLPDQPGIRSDAFGQVAQSHFHDSMADGPTARTSSFVLGNEQLPRVHGVQGHISRVRLLSQQDRQGHALSSPPRDDDRVPERDSLTNVRINSQFSDHPIVGPEDSYVASDGQIFQNDAIVCIYIKLMVSKTIKNNSIFFFFFFFFLGLYQGLFYIFCFLI
jgi:hypothetical protein